MIHFREETKKLLILGLPLIVNYFIEGCPNFINNAMIAHLGTEELAAGAIVNSAFSSLLLFFYGILIAASTLISHHYGAKAIKSIGDIVKDASILAFFFSIILMTLLWYGGNILRWAGQPDSLIVLATPYLHGLMFAVIPDFFSMVMWQFFLGLGKPKVTLISSALYVPINVFANYTLMFGHFGFPALGMFGIGLGTSVGFYLLTFGFIAYIFYKPEYRQYFVGWFASDYGKYLKSLLSIGFPMGVMWTIDFSFIMITAFLVGKLSITLLAAQQISIQASGLVFLVLAGLSQAISIRLGHSWGAKNYALAKDIAYAGTVLVAGLSLLFSLCFWFKPDWIIGIDFNLLDPHNAEVISLARDILWIFGFYILVNSFRYAVFALLRALKVTYFPAFCSLLGFYGLGLGLGYPLLFHWNGSLNLFWINMSCVLIIITALMYRRFFQRIKIHD